MCVTLDTLELVPEEVDRAKERVRWLAYANWQAAGCPPESALQYWLEAERHWIEYEYTPHRDDTVLHH